MTNRLKSTVIGSLTAILLSGSAFAAGLHDKGSSLKDDGDVILSGNATDFSGLYVGVGVGGEFLGGDPDTNNGTIGGVVDGVIGWDFRRDSFVIGPRIVAGLSNLDDEDPCANTALDAFLNFGGRAGIVFNRTLVYVHAGYEMQWFSSENSGYDAWLANADTNAFTGGVGIETILAGSWSIAAEGGLVSGLNDAEDVDGWRGVVRINRQF